MYDPRNIGYLVKVFGGGAARGVAAGTGDATEVVSTYVDRLASASGPFLSALIAVFGQATLAAAATLKCGLKLKDADAADGTGAADFAVINANTVVVATGGTGGTTENVAVGGNVDLSGARRYIAISWTPDLSASGTDVFTLGGAIVLGGASELPAV